MRKYKHLLNLPHIKHTINPSKTDLFLTPVNKSIKPNARLIRIKGYSSHFDAILMLINALLFNLSWLGLIFFGNVFIPLVLLWLYLHLRQAQHKSGELKLIVIVAFIGIVVDSLLSFYKVFLFSDPHFIIPLWLVCLWLAFAATLKHSLSPINRIPLAKQCIAILGAPMSYFAGEKAGVVSFGYSDITTFLTLSVIWLVLFNLFMYLSTKKAFCHA